MDCIEKYLEKTAEEIYDGWLSNLEETDYDYIYTLAYNAGDSLSEQILYKIEAILDEKNIKIHM